MKLFKLMAMTVIMSLVLVGCSSNSKKKDGSASDSVVDDSAMNNPLELNGSSDQSTAGGLQTIYFAFDSSSLSSAGRTTLEMNANYLKDNDSIDIQVEGHSDERGGEQYNLALGERRARAIKDYLVALGVEAGRVSIISFGKTTPLEFGHDESAWSKNRRGNFVITAK